MLPCVRGGRFRDGSVPHSRRGSHISQERLRCRALNLGAAEAFYAAQVVQFISGQKAKGDPLHGC